MTPYGVIVFAIRRNQMMLDVIIADIGEGVSRRGVSAEDHPRLLNDNHKIKINSKNHK